MPAKPTTIDEYLAGVRPEQRVALEKLRKVIRAAAPEAEEGISYGLAAFRLDGRPLVAFGARPGHCAFYPMSGTTIAAHKDELAKYDTSKGTIRFPADKPLPAALVRKLVKARIAEQAGRGDRPSAVRTRLAKSDPDGRRMDPGVVAFLRGLDHARKPDIEAVRKIILGAGPEIREGIKWNSPSFRTTEYFATLNLREGRVWLILHTGARPKGGPANGVQVSDPAGLLKWLANDRCLVTFADGKDVRAKRSALRAIIRQWIRQL